MLKRMKRNLKEKMLQLRTGQKCEPGISELEKQQTAKF
jgi:hypothetical protein